MTFRTYGNLVCRAWLVLLIAWAALFGVTWAFAPPWDEFAKDSDTSFLPQDAPSIRAQEIFAKAFPQDKSASNIVLVLHQKDDEKWDRAQALKFIDDVLEPRLRAIAQTEGGLAGETRPSEEPLFGDDTEPAKPAPPPKRSIIFQIHTPSAPGAGALLSSADGQAFLVVLELTTEYSAHVNWPTIGKIETLLGALKREHELPAGTQLDITGSAVTGRDYFEAETESAHNTEVLTILLVVALLVLIYRVPFLAIVPLLTVALSVKIALNVLALLAEARWLALFSGMEIFVTILSYGAGIDYCLFLTARFREELHKDGDPCGAISRAIGTVGAAVLASAATVICGIGMMAFARFGKFHEAGLAIPLSLALALAATLSFSPSLLRLAGRWVFWPQRLGDVAHEDETNPPARRHWWQGGGLLQTLWDDAGRLLCRRPALALTVTASLMAPFAILAIIFHNDLSYDMIADLPQSAPSVVGARALQKHFPEGLVGIVTVLILDPDVDFATPAGRSVVERLTERLVADREALGLADVRSLTAPLGITPAAKQAFDGANLSPEARRDAEKRVAIDRYTTALGERKRTGTRMDLVLTHNPLSPRSFADLGRIEATLHAALAAAARARTQIYLVGTTASIRDLSTVIEEDRWRIQLLVLSSVMVILVVLLRGIIVPLYLLATVLFSYFATLGVTFVLFWALDRHGFAGIDWKVAIFLFTILIAVGADYNIFLMTRVHEEQERHGPVAGITTALTKTGPIISSCGIIMAGTFASLMSGTLIEMKQLGFALTFGVMLDTFVVRPILVPAFLVLLARRKQPPLAG